VPQVHQVEKPFYHRKKVEDTVITENIKQEILSWLSVASISY